MGGIDKGLALLQGEPLVGHVLARFAPQVSTLIINANRSEAEYAALGTSYGARVVPDSLAGFAGPLAGLAAGMADAAQLNAAKLADALIATVPCDSPFFPLDLVARLRAPFDADETKIAVVRSPSGSQPVFAVYRLSLLGSLLDFLGSGRRKIDAWTALHATVHVDFEDESAFANINTEAELKQY